MYIRSKRASGILTSIKTSADILEYPSNMNIFLSDLINPQTSDFSLGLGRKTWDSTKNAESKFIITAKFNTKNTHWINWNQES
jgi:hypothetical protein